MRRITAKEFFTAFRSATKEMLHDPIPVETTSRKPYMTKAMFGPDGVLTCSVAKLSRHEELLPVEGKYKYDFMIWDKSPTFGNKIEYRQPLYVHAVVEHENGPNPEEEFWKLLHFYTPLKVLIFYSDNVEKHLSGFTDTFRRVDAFHSRNKTEEYLAICGNCGSNPPSWKGWIAAESRDWVELQ